MKKLILMLVLDILFLPLLAPAQSGPAARVDHPAKLVYRLKHIPGHPSPAAVSFKVMLHGCPFTYSDHGSALVTQQTTISFSADGLAVDDAGNPANVLLSNDKDITCGRSGIFATWYTVSLSAPGRTWPEKKLVARSGKKLDLVKIALGK